MAGLAKSTGFVPREQRPGLELTVTPRAMFGVRWSRGFLKLRERQRAYDPFPKGIRRQPL